MLITVYINWGVDTLTHCTVTVSVIVAVYNSEKYLCQCIDSIVNQTLRNIEVICINDGSTDSSLSILQEYAQNDTRIRIFTKDNEGLGGASARNLGLSLAKGKYVSILDSDDFFDLTMLEKSYNRAEASDADIVVFGGYEYDNATGVSSPVGSILNENALPVQEVFSVRHCPQSIFQISSGMAWNKLYRNSFLKKHNILFQHIKYTDDAYFTFAHMVLAQKIAVVKENLCYYRVNSGTNQTAGLSNYPDSAYVPYLALRKSLIKWSVYSLVEQSMLNCGVAFMRYFYDKINRYESFEYLHNKLRQDIFAKLQLVDKPKDFFYHERSYMWCQQILRHTAGEVVFNAARAYGSDCTTGILRFRFPYEHIKVGSNVVLWGARVMAQHYYAQSILSGYCHIVTCVSQENPFALPYVQPMQNILNLSFDYVLIAYAEDWLVNPAVKYLHNIGVPDEKIILGGNIT